MERLKKFTKILLIFIIFLVFNENIKGMGDLTEYGNSESSSSVGSGGYNGIYGIRLAVVDKNGNVIVKTDFINYDLDRWSVAWTNAYGEKYYNFYNKEFYTKYNKCTKIEKNMGKCTIGTKNAACVTFGETSTPTKQYSGCIFENSLPRFVQGVSSPDIETWLTTDSYSNLKELMRKADYKCLNEKTGVCQSYQTHYVILEPLYSMSRFIGTGYELANMPTSDSDSCVGYLCYPTYKTATYNMQGTLHVKNEFNLFNFEENGTYYDRNGTNFKSAAEELKNSKNKSGIALYSITEIFPICKYDQSSGKWYDKEGKLVDKTAYEDSCLEKKYKITINKVNNITGKKITGKNVQLQVYIGTNNCTEKSGYPKPKALSGDSGTFTITDIDKKYFKDGNVPISVKEIKAPGGYLSPTDNCVYKGILSNNMNITIPNTPGCVVEFNELTEAQKNDIDIRDSLFNKYKDIPSPNGGNFTNLYDLKKMNGEEVCTEAECDYPEFPGGSPGDDDSSYCMTGGIALQQDFNQRNMACFDNRLVDGDNRVVGLCSSKLIISRPIDIKTDTFHYIEKGLPIFTTNYPIKQTIETTCYSFDGSYKDTYKLEKEYDNKNSTASLKYLGKEQINTKTSDYNVLKTYNNGYVFTSTINYYLKPNFLKIGIGTNNSSGGTNVYTGKYGIMSKSTDDLELSMYNFKKIDPEKFGIIKFTATLPLISSNENVKLNGECKYSFRNSLYTPPPGGGGSPNELNIQFRTIDVNNPFPGKDGKSNRPIGSNWRGYCIPRSNTDSSCDYELNETILLADINKNGIIDSSESRLLTRYFNGISVPEFEGIDIDKVAIDIRRTILRLQSGLDGTTFIKKYITDAVNSYGRDVSGDSKDPIYTLILTPSDIRQIRKYNSYTSYDDYISMNEEKCDEDNLFACDNEDTFRMKFIDGLKNGKLEFEKKSSLNLSNKLKVLEN